MYSDLPHPEYDGDILNDNVNTIARSLNAEFTNFQQNELRKEHAKC